MENLMHVSRGALLLIAGAGVMACADSRGSERRLFEPRAADRSEGARASNAAHLDLNEERAGLLAADHSYSQFSATTNLVEGTMNMVAPAIIYIAPGAYITTAAQVRTLLQSNPANLTAVLTWAAVRADVSSDAQRGYTYGFTEIRLPDGSIVPGKYLAYWKRQSDNSWKLAAYRRNLRPAGEVSLVAPAGFETPDYKHYRYFPKTDAASELAAVFAADQAFSDLAQSGVSEAFVAFAAPDAAVLGRAAGIGFGTQAIIENQQGALPGSLVWSASFGDAAETGDLAFTTGFAQTRVQNPDGTWRVTGQGKYLTIWKKQRTGEWRFVIDG
jgi:ketosteroid isomerase-like protein